MYTCVPVERTVDVTTMTQAAETGTRTTYECRPVKKTVQQSYCEMVAFKTTVKVAVPTPCAMPAPAPCGSPCGVPAAVGCAACGGC